MREGRSFEELREERADEYPRLVLRVLSLDSRLQHTPCLCMVVRCVIDAASWRHSYLHPEYTITHDLNHMLYCSHFTLVHSQFSSTNTLPSWDRAQLGEHNHSDSPTTLAVTD